MTHPRISWCSLAWALSSVSRSPWFYISAHNASSAQSAARAPRDLRHPRCARLRTFMLFFYLYRHGFLSFGVMHMHFLASMCSVARVTVCARFQALLMYPRAFTRVVLSLNSSHTPAVTRPSRVRAASSPLRTRARVYPAPAWPRSPRPAPRCTQRPCAGRRTTRARRAATSTTKVWGHRERHRQAQSNSINTVLAIEKVHYIHMRSVRLRQSPQSHEYLNRWSTDHSTHFAATKQKAMSTHESSKLEKFKIEKKFMFESWSEKLELNKSN
jgi:hypothetical protein